MNGFNFWHESAHTIVADHHQGLDRLLYYSFLMWRPKNVSKIV